MLHTLVDEAKTLAKSILSLSNPTEFSDSRAAESEAVKFAVHIHLFSLMFEVSHHSLSYSILSLQRTFLNA